MLCALRPQERAPGEPGALAGGREAGLAEQLAHGGSRDGKAQAAEFAGDPLVTPTRVLTGEAQHQLADLASDRRPASPRRIGPALLHQSAVPTKQRRWRDEKRTPARSRQQPAGGGEEEPIGGPQLRPSDLTT